MKKSPFGQTSVRFKFNKQALQIPGSELYTTQHFFMSSLSTLAGPGMYNDMAATSLAVQLSKKAM